MVTAAIAYLLICIAVTITALLQIAGQFLPVLPIQLVGLIHLYQSYLYDGLA